MQSLLLQELPHAKEEALILKEQRLASDYALFLKDVWFNLPSKEEVWERELANLGQGIQANMRYLPQVVPRHEGKGEGVRKISRDFFEKKISAKFSVPLRGVEKGGTIQVIEDY
jgi:hypothetical protein